MNRYAIHATYCTRGGNLGRWAWETEADDPATALAHGINRLLRTHRGISRPDVSATLIKAPTA